MRLKYRKCLKCLHLKCLKNHWYLKFPKCLMYLKCLILQMFLKFLIRLKYRLFLKFH